MLIAHLQAGGQGGGGTPRPTQDGCLSQPKLRSTRGFITNPTFFTVMDNLASHGSPFSSLPPLGSVLPHGRYHFPAPDLFQLPVLPLQATPWYP